MYSKEQIKEIVKDNSFSTKVWHEWGDSCLILVPNFEEYSFLFGNGKTKTCYAHNSIYWNEYHQKNSREIDFLSISNDITKQYQYITFCFQITDIDWYKYNYGGSGIISGNIIVHDLNHFYYSFSFLAPFHKTSENKAYIDEDFIRVNLDINQSKKYLDSTMNFVDFCRTFNKRGLIPTVIKMGCIDVINTEQKNVKS